MIDRSQTDGPSRDDRAAELFEHALSLDTAKRNAFLESACAGDAELRAELDSMLRAHERAGGFLEARGDDATGGSEATGGAVAEETIDRYRLLRPIGEGGFGVVYLAEQQVPVTRLVALKIIKLGMDTRQVIARFEGERQTLAVMDHPHIARVYDAGATASGRPYFVMELVDGVPITRLCAEQGLETRARLTLFVKVCQAIQHAHQKGIIHRDIKPSNVLVTAHDGVFNPKVIDFGIAKATNAALTERTAFTEQRQMIGTPAYMSPEQTGMGAADIDTRSDIYSLGVLLYEMLTGSTPFDVRALRSAGHDEMMRIIREQEPVKPSTRMLTKQADERNGAKRSAVNAQRLGLQLRGDLDWIVMKCLEKDRARRYESAASLAADVVRHLNDEPVLAGPPSRGYRVGKFVRRHRGAVLAGALVAAVLVAATGVSIAFAMREAAALGRERVALGEARQQAVAAEAARRLAEDRAAETAQVAEFQANLLVGIDLEEMGHGIKRHVREQLQRALAGAPERAGANGAKSAEEIVAALSVLDAQVADSVPADIARGVLDEYVLRRAALAAETRFGDQPLVHAQLREALGRTYRALGMYQAAEAHYRAALDLRRRTLGPDDLSVATCLNNLASTVFDGGDLAAAEPLLREAVALHRARETIGSEDGATTLSNLGLVLIHKGDPVGAEALHREALEWQYKLYGSEHELIARTLNNLAGARYFQNDLAGAEELFREVLAMERALLGAEHPALAATLHNLGGVLRARGDLAGAEAANREALAVQRKALGNDHPSVATSLNNLALVLKQQGEIAEAESLYREALALRRALLGEDHPDVAASMHNLAVLLRDRGDYVGAEPYFRAAMAVHDKRLPPGHVLAAVSQMGLASVLVRQSYEGEGDPSARLAEAEALLVAAEAAFSKSQSTSPAHVKKMLETFVELYEAWDTHDPAGGFGAKAAARRDRLAVTASESN